MLLVHMQRSDVREEFIGRPLEEAVVVDGSVMVSLARRTLVFGDMVPEPMAEPPAFPPEFTVQKHDMTDVLYSLKKKP